MTMPVTSNYPWLWKRLHRASDAEAVELTRRGAILPTDPGAGAALNAYRAEVGTPRAHTHA